MTTVRISELVDELRRLQGLVGDVPVALWDLDTGGYFQLSAASIEAQLMSGGTPRLSIGVNAFDDARCEEPAARPLLFPRAK